MENLKDSKVRISSFIGFKCLTEEEGILLYNEMSDLIKSSKMVILDFSNVTVVSNEFLSVSLGRFVELNPLKKSKISLIFPKENPILSHKLNNYLLD